MQTKCCMIILLLITPAKSFLLCIKFPYERNEGVEDVLLVKSSNRSGKVSVDWKVAHHHMQTWKKPTCFLDSVKIVKACHNSDEIFSFNLVLLILSLCLSSITRESECMGEKKKRKPEYYTPRIISRCKIILILWLEYRRTNIWNISWIS